MCVYIYTIYKKKAVNLLLYSVCVETECEH